MDGEGARQRPELGNGYAPDIALRQPNWPVARDPSRQLLPQPARAADAVLCAGGLHPDHASTNDILFVLLAWAVRRSHASRTPTIHTGSNDVDAGAPRRCSSAASYSSSCGSIFAVRILTRRGPEARAARRAAQGRRRGARGDPGAPPPGGDGAGRLGQGHRFAGSGDRSAIGNLVYDALRRRRSLAAQMGADTPRALALAAAPRALGLSAAEVVGDADGSAHALEPLSEAEQARLGARAAGRCARRDARRHPRLAAAVVRARLRRGCRRGRRGAWRARARRSARQHAEGRPREGPEGAGRASRRCRRRCRRVGVRIPAPEGAGRAAQRRSRDRRTARAGSRCRTRARRSRR